MKKLLLCSCLWYFLDLLHRRRQEGRVNDIPDVVLSRFWPVSACFSRRISKDFAHGIYIVMNLSLRSSSNYYSLKHFKKILENTKIDLRVSAGANKSGRNPARSVILEISDIFCAESRRMWAKQYRIAGVRWSQKIWVKSVQIRGELLFFKS